MVSSLSMAIAEAARPARAVSSNEDAAAALEDMLADDRPYLLVCEIKPDYPSL